MIESLIKVALNKDSELHSVVIFIIKTILTIFLSVKLYGVWIGSTWLYSLPTIEEIYKWVSTGDIIIGIGTYFFVWFIFYEVIRFFLSIYIFSVIKRTDKIFEILFNTIKIISSEEISSLRGIKGFDFVKSSGFIDVVDGKLIPGWVVLDIVEGIKKSTTESDKRSHLLSTTHPSVIVHFTVAILYVPSLFLLPWWLLLLGLMSLIILFIFEMLILTLEILFDKYKRNFINLADSYSNVDIKSLQ